MLPEVIGDNRRFQQVLINLVKNALKFTAKGRITIKAGYREDAGCLVVHVCDTGLGIDQTEIPKLFTRFGKLHRTADMNSTGIGLGLTIVKQIVESAKGEIEVRSDGVGKGSTFLFSMQVEKVVQIEELVERDPETIIDTSDRLN